MLAKLFYEQLKYGYFTNFLRVYLFYAFDAKNL